MVVWPTRCNQKKPGEPTVTTWDTVAATLASCAPLAWWWRYPGNGCGAWRCGPWWYPWHPSGYPYGSKFIKIHESDNTRTHSDTLGQPWHHSDTLCQPWHHSDTLGDTLGDTETHLVTLRQKRQNSQKDRLNLMQKSQNVKTDNFRVFSVFIRNVRIPCLSVFIRVY